VASPVSLAQLESMTRRKSDTENKIQRHPVADVYDYINRGIKAFHTELVRVRGQGYSEADTFFVTAQGQETYPLPATFLQVLKVWTNLQSRECILRSYEEPETHGMRDNVPFDAFQSLPMYRLRGDNISIRPTPSNVLQINVRYVSTLVQLTSPSNTIDGFDGFDEFIVCFAAREIGMKDNKLEFVGACSAQMGEVLDRIRATHRARNAGEPQRMIDTRGSSMVRHYGRGARGYGWRW